MSSRPTPRPAPLAVLAWMLVAAPAGAAAHSADSLDAFAETDAELVVTGATKRAQPLSETPSSVTVITAAEIRANGYHTLAEALRWVRGVHVTYDRNYQYVGVRGVQRPGDYNNKVLLTIDGHPMNGAVFGDASIGEDLGLDLEAVERIEVVRGPGSTLYGSYAVLAVVNVVTRAPGRGPGVVATARAGSQQDRRAHLSVADAAGGISWRVNGSLLGVAGEDLYFAEYDDPLVTGDGFAVGGDGERAFAFHGTAEWGANRLVAKANQRIKRIPTGAFGIRFDDRRNRTVDGHDFVELSRRMRPSSGTELVARAYWDAVRYQGFYLYGPDSATVVNFDRGDADLLGTEWRLHWTPAPGHVLTSGIDVQGRVCTRLENYDESPYASVTDVRSNDAHAGVYVQEEVQFGARALATAGVRVDRYADFDPVLSPRVDLLWHSSPATTWKVLAGSAFRAPSLYETHYSAPDQIAAPTLNPERVVSIEAEVEHDAGPFAASLSAYRHQIRDLIDLVTVDTSGTLQLQSIGAATGYGVEGELRMVTARGTRARLAAALLDNDFTGTGQDLTNSPNFNAHLVVSHAPRDGATTVGAGLRYLSPRLTRAGTRTREALVFDGRVGVALPAGLQLGLEVKNLFDRRYGDPGSAEHLQNEIEQDGRAFFATLVCQP